MSSVLAIVSKALFEKMVPKKEAALGAVVDTDQYVSGNKTFDGIGAGDAIFLVTVRPPSEKLWLVGVLESPKKKGDTWKASGNVAPLTDITAAIKKFEFQSGSGLKAKKGALGMSLQTPRALTAGDVKLLRGMLPKTKAAGKKVAASDAYKKAVDAVVHKHKGSAKLGRFRLDNHRKPFTGKLADLGKTEKLQLQHILGKKVKLESVFGGNGGGGDDEDEDELEEITELEIADVIDTESGRVVYQLYIWPYGDGTILEHGKTDAISHICQHGLDPVKELGKGWISDFAKAWMEGSKRLKMWTGHIDFDADDLGADEDDDE